MNIPYSFEIIIPSTKVWLKKSLFRLLCDWLFVISKYCQSNICYSQILFVKYLLQQILYLRLFCNSNIFLSIYLVRCFLKHHLFTIWTLRYKYCTLEYFATAIIFLSIYLFSTEFPVEISTSIKMCLTIFNCFYDFICVVFSYETDAYCTPPHE